MDDLVVWIIIIGFFAPLHFLLPVLVLFVTGQESEQARGLMIRRALVDSALSLLIAFAIVIYLVQQGHMLPAMMILLFAVGAPFVRIWTHRKEIRRAAG